MTTPRITAALLIAAAATTASAQVYRLGTDAGLSQSISDNGTVVGDNGAGAPYFMWNAANGITSIGGVSAGNGVGGTPKISNDGRWVGGTTYNPSQDWHEISRYEVSSDTWTGFGGLGQQIDAETSSGWGLSGDGQNVVGLAWVPTGGAHAVRWNITDGLVDLGSTVDGRSSRANDTDFDGNVVAGWQDGAGRQGAVWVDGVQELIFDNNGVASQEAFRVSDDGQWVTGMGIGPRNGAGESYRYNTVTDTYEAIPNLASGGQRFMAGNAITADGSTIAGGTWAQGPATFGTAFIWREGVGTMTLSDYLDEVGVSYDPDFTFAFVSDISSDGRWITGWGAEGFATETFVIHIPAPTSAAVLGLGGLLAARRRR
ncbi:MAG: hypothetical protein ACF8LK_05875 [Phycisphaerales bacterium JB041]